MNFIFRLCRSYFITLFKKNTNRDNNFNNTSAIS